MEHQYFIIYKPYDVISQFTKEGENDMTLRDLNFEFPKDVYPVGRLDKDSEGLLLLTNDNKLKDRLLSPKFQHKKTYYVQVENIPTTEALKQLRVGVMIRIDKNDYKTLPADVHYLSEEPLLPLRKPPVRFRQNIPTAWIKVTLTEGKNRQVRRMCAAVGFPVLRLVRSQMESLMIADMHSGEVREMSKKEIYKYLKVDAIA